MTREEVLPICTRSQYSSTACHRIEFTYQEDNRHIQQESNHSVGNQSPDTDVVDVGHGEVGDLEEQGSNTVHHSANRSEVVERDNGIHLVLGRAEKTLDHDQTGGLEDDTTNLEEESNEDELDFTNGGNDDTKDDDTDVEEDPQVDGGHSHGPRSQQHSNGSGGLISVLTSPAIRPGDFRVKRTLSI